MTKHTCFGALAVGALALTMTTAARADTITIRSDYWYPYNGEPGRNPEGYMIDLLRGIAKQQGHTLDYRLLDWELSLSRSLEGSVDCVVGATRSDAPKHALTSAPWGKTLNVVYALDDSSVRVPDIATLGQVRVVAVSDYSYGEAMDAVLGEENAKVVRVQATRRAFGTMAMYLVTRKADVLVEDSNVATAELKVLNLSERVVPIAQLAEPDDLYVACTPNARGRAWITLFEQGLAQARASGELAKTLTGYGLTDWALPAASATPASH